MLSVGNLQEECFVVKWAGGGGVSLCNLPGQCFVVKWGNANYYFSLQGVKSRNSKWIGKITRSHCKH